MVQAASTFDPEYFATLLKDEVEKLAQERYGGLSIGALGKSFAFWCIKTLSPQLSDEDAEIARSICETGGAGDFRVDGAWLDGERLYIMQAKYQTPKFPLTEDERFNPLVFAPDAAEQLGKSFFELHEELGNKGKKTDSKIIRLLALYRKAVEQRKRIELIVAISGRAKKSLNTEIHKLNDKLDEDRPHFDKHYFSLFDHTRLNQVYSGNRLPKPKIVNLNTKEKFVVKNTDGSIYALAATVDATELIRIRDENNHNIYHSNFRFLLNGARGVAAPKIVATLQDEIERNNFWRYNNGITISCEKLTPNQPGLGFTADSWAIEGFQVVNGLQTIETLYRNKDKDWFDGVSLLVRVIPTGDTDANAEATKLLEEHIAEYSNSQSPITARDLRANDPIQLFLESELADIYDVQYIRKAGEGAQGRPARKVFSNEFAAQAALSFWYGKSNEAKASKKLLFEREISARPGFYEDLFKEGITTSEYILLPTLLLSKQKPVIRKVRDKRSRGLHKALNLLALAVVGDAIKQKVHIGSVPSSSANVKQELKKIIERAETLSDAQVNKIWKPVFADLIKVVNARRTRQAKSEGIAADAVSARNVIVGMKYTDPTLRSQIWRRGEIKKLPRVLKNALEL